MDLLRGYSNLNDQWIAPFNGYQYKITESTHSWEESRRICQDWGGEMVVYGVRDFQMRG